MKLQNIKEIIEDELINHYGFTKYKSNEAGDKIDFTYDHSLHSLGETGNLDWGYTLRFEKYKNIINKYSYTCSLCIMGWCLSSGHCIEYYRINRNWNEEKLKKEIKKITDIFICKYSEFM